MTLAQGDQPDFRAAEASVRTSLTRLEASFRSTALRALADWERLGIASTDLFSALASLQRPSWGSWNGLISALRTARKNALRTAKQPTREAIEGATVLAEVLEALDEPVPAEVAASLEPLATLTRKSAKRLKLGGALEMPIALRNRVAHDTPTDGAWWEAAATALRPLEEFLKARGPLGGEALPAPWLLESDGEVWALNGVADDFSVIYISSTGKTRHDAARGRDVLLAFQKLLGKSDIQERDFRKLLTKLAPEEIRGVLMGDFLVGRPAGKGGFATVHVGRQLSTGRKVAVKIPADGLDEEARVRFQQEAAYLARFDHPGIVKVLGYGEEAWTAPRAFSLSGEEWYGEFAKGSAVRSYIALEWIEGKTLDDVFKEGRPNPVVLTGWFLQAAEALAAVHGSGLIHRDVKPGNLMVTGDGAIKLMDFGIARSQGAARTLITGTGASLGTPAYMSPEQLVVRQADTDLGPQTDVYSLCATFYELFTGRRLFDHDRESDDTVRTRKTRGDLPPRPSATVTGLTWELETILLGGLQKELSDRFKTMEALARDLRHVERNEPIEFRRPSMARRAQLGYRRQRALSNAAAVFTLVAVAGVVAYVVSIKKEQERTEGQRQIAVANAAKEKAERERADLRTTEARQRLAQLLLEMGRQASLQGENNQALAFFAAAIEEGGDDPVLRFLGGRALSSESALLARLTGHANNINQFETSADGRRLLTTDSGGSARLWNTRTGGCERVLEAGGHASHGSFSADGSRAVTFSEDVFQVWDAESGKLLREFQVKDTVTSAALSPDGTRVAAGFMLDGKLEVSIVDGSQGPSKLDTGKNGAVTVSFSADGGFLFAADSQGRIRVWRFPDLARALDLKTENFPEASLMSGGDRLVVVCPSCDPALYEFPSGRLVTALEGKGAGSGLCFDRAGKRIVSGGVMYDSATGGAISKSPFEGFQCGFSDDGGAIASIVLKGSRFTIEIRDSSSGSIQATHEFTSSSDAMQVAFVPGTALILGVAGRRAWLWRWRDWQDDRPIAINGEPTAAEFCPDGTSLLACEEWPSRWDQEAGERGEVRVWDLQNWKERSLLRHGSRAMAFATMNMDGTRIASSPANGGFPLLWDTGTGKLLLEMDCPDEGAAVVDPTWHRVVFNPIGDRILTTGAATRVQLRETSTGTEIARLKGHTGEVVDGVFSADSACVATVSVDRTVRLWNARDGAPLHTLEHPGPVAMARFAPHGLTLATACANNVLVWKVADGRVAHKLSHHVQQVNAVAWHPSGDMLAAASEDGTVSFWNPHDGSLAGVITAPVDDAAADLDLENEAAAHHRDAIVSVLFALKGAVLVTAQWGGRVQIWDTATRQLLAQIPTGQRPSCLALSGDGQRLAIASSHEIRVIGLGPPDLAVQDLAEKMRACSSYRVRNGKLESVDGMGEAPK